MGITASNLSFGEVNRRFYGRKLRFTAPLTRRRKTKFPTAKTPIYLPKCQIWMQLSPKYGLKIMLKRILNTESSFHLKCYNGMANSVHWVNTVCPDLTVWIFQNKCETHVRICSKINDKTLFFSYILHEYVIPMFHWSVKLINVGCIIFFMFKSLNI